MKIRAAVLEEFGQPLVVQDVELAGPRAGEVLVRVEACGVCHTDLYTASGADPSGYAPSVLGHEGAGVVEARRRRRHERRARRPRRSRCSRPQCGECIHCRQPAHEPLPRDPRPAGPRPPARRHDAPLARRRAAAPLHGHVTFAEATVMPEIALAKVGPDVPLEAVEHLRLRATTGLGAAMYTAKVEPGSTCAVFGCGLVGLGVVAGCRLRAPSASSAIDLSRGAPRNGAPPRRDRHDASRATTSCSARRDDRRLRRRLHVRGHRARRGHAPGGRVGARGLGPRAR